MEDTLQEGQVDDAELAHQGAEDGVIEHLVLEEAELAAQHGLGFTAAGQGVEHVEEDETGEGHGGVVVGDDARVPVRLESVCVGVGVAHLVHVHDKRAQHDDERRCQYTLDQGSGEDARASGSWWARHDGWVDGLDA